MAKESPYSSPPCTSKMNDKLLFLSEVGMPTTNPRIKLFNGKADSSELFFGKRDVLGFPIHFARPPVDKRGKGMIYIEGWLSRPSLSSSPLFSPPLPSSPDTRNITGPAGCARESPWNIFGQLGDSSLNAISGVEFQVNSRKG